MKVDEIKALTGQPLSDAVLYDVMQAVLSSGSDHGESAWYIPNKVEGAPFDFLCKPEVWQPHLDLNQCMEVVKAVDRDDFAVSKTELRERQNFEPHKRCVYEIYPKLHWKSVRAYGTTPQEAMLRACLLAVQKGKDDS